MRITIILLTFLTTLNCCNVFSQKEYKELIIDNDSLKITYLIKAPIKINNKESKYWTIKGILKVENKKSTATKYGNGITNLVINDSLKARPYINTFATILIDCAIIDLLPNEKREFEVYWKFHSTILQVDNINIENKKAILGIGDL